jgi:putative oligomerization/nucleic acid binding protein
VEPWIYIGIAWIVWGLASTLIARSRGAANPPPWSVMGMLLGPFAMVFALRAARPSDEEFTMESLNRLSEQRAQGALSNEEFEAKRGELLGRMPHER